ncbi:Ribosomal protein S18 acetylase RimI [Paenibacillus sp. UNC496MF]|uniref:GNAT family N-acetyltransferase n=1 Tax=Paenibacillus sp. UNC496MF TaxID=1502753 RepID=UPI0008E53325|nr:GNAT family N-acetyltransferase [Paenibacillus sp. UNC496MF]SFI35681.1 Ribosomal protein S18 acetylase RimI [Paenibacillus sp. UNC496MF]
MIIGPLQDTGEEEGSVRIGMEFIVRRARLADAEALRELYVEAAAWIREAKGIAQWQEGWFTQAFIENFIGEHTVFAAMAEGRPVGCFSVHWAYEDIWGELYHEDAGYVHKLVTSRKHRGHGIGTRLLEQAAGYIREQGKSWLRLDCMADNPALNAFYVRHGLTLRGRFDGEYSAHLYEMRLDAGAE